MAGTKLSTQLYPTEVLSFSSLIYGSLANPALAGKALVSKLQSLGPLISLKGSVKNKKSNSFARRLKFKSVPPDGSY